MATLRPDTSVERFKETPQRVAVEQGESFSGFVTHSNDQIHTFTRTRYPRKKYGIPTIEAITASIRLLAERLRDIQIVDETALRKNILRVVLGLLEGYEKDSPIHTIDEVRRELGDTSLRAISANVIVVRPDGTGSCDVYTESCAVITGLPDEIEAVYDLADKFKQQRFTVEDFNRKLAWIVETPHYTNPDTEY